MIWDLLLSALFLQPVSQNPPASNAATATAAILINIHPSAASNLYSISKLTSFEGRARREVNRRISETARNHSRRRISSKSLTSSHRHFSLSLSMVTYNRVSTEGTNRSQRWLLVVARTIRSVDLAQQGFHQVKWSEVVQSCIRAPQGWGVSYMMSFLNLSSLSQISLITNHMPV